MSLEVEFWRGDFSRKKRLFKTGDANPRFPLPRLPPVRSNDNVPLPHPDSVYRRSTVASPTLRKYHRLLRKYQASFMRWKEFHGRQLTSAFCLFRQMQLNAFLLVEDKKACQCKCLIPSLLPSSLHPDPSI